VKDEIGERLNRAVPGCVAVTIKCESGCGGLQGMILYVFAGAQQLRSNLLGNFFSDTLLSLSPTLSYIILFFST
jgi:hypothetical protein